MALTIIIIMILTTTDKIPNKEIREILEEAKEHGLKEELMSKIL